MELSLTRLEYAVTQNLVSISYTDEQLAAADAAIDQLETVFANFIALTPAERRSINRMGDITQPFCEKTLRMMEQNANLIPPVLDVAEARNDLLALNQLIPRLERLERLAERGNDTHAALGSDVYMLCLAGYGIMDKAGLGQGLDSLRKELSVRFAKKRRKPTEEAAAAKGKKTGSAKEKEKPETDDDNT